MDIEGNVNKITKIGYRNNSCSGCAYCCLLGTATAFYVGLRGKVTALEKQLQRLEKHSLLVFYDKWITTKGTAAFFDDTLKSREENG